MYNSNNTRPDAGQGDDQQLNTHPSPSKQENNIHIAIGTTHPTNAVTEREQMTIGSSIGGGDGDRSLARDRVIGVAATEADRQAALEICPLVGQVHDSTLWVVDKIFADSRDRRVRRGGSLFVAHLLRLGTLIQLSLFPGTEAGDVVRIAIPNVLKLCLNRRKNGWGWCYDTTLKYIRLLVAAGVLITRPDEPGIYYLPLGAYALPPEHAARQVEKLAGQRSKVSRSTAFKRTALHSALIDEPWMVDSSGRDVLVVDESEMQRMVQTLCAAVQRQGIAVQTATMVEMTRIVAKHAPRVLKKGDGRFVVRRKVVDSCSEESTTFALKEVQPDAHPGKNLLSGPGIERTNQQESTTLASNLPVDPNMVDSSRAALSDSLITKSNKDSSSEYTISENGGQESTSLTPDQKIVDSSLSEHPLTSAFTPSVMLSWRFPDNEERHIQVGEDTKEPDALAALLSDYFEGNDSRVRYYRKRVGQDSRVLDLAVIDGIVRSVFPDRRHRHDHLGGAWVTQQFIAYRSGEQVDPAILAWANTSYSYESIEAMLEKAANWQETQQGQPRHRPFPHEVVIDADQIGDFWAAGGSQGLRATGYVGVDLDGNLMTCEEFESRWRVLLQHKLDTDPCALSPEVEADVLSWYNWNAPRMCDRETEAKLLASLPDKLLPYLHDLEQALDGEHYVVEVKVTPLTRRRVIVVSMRHDPMQSWTLPYGQDVEAFIAWYKQEEGQVR